MPQNPCDVAACVSGKCAPALAVDGTPCGGIDICKGGVCNPAKCTAPFCPLGVVTACSGLQKTYCCGADGFVAACEIVGKGFVTNDCPVDCGPPCVVSDAGPPVCDISLDGG